jgi:branched-chain amino acid transport system permease protein
VSHVTVSRRSGAVHRRVLVTLAAAAFVAATMLVFSAPAGAQDDGESPTPSAEGLAGRFVNPEADRAPVKGVTVEVFDDSGKSMGSETSDEEGRYSLDLPGPGSYRVVLDTDSLPDDVSLTDADRSELTVTINPGQRKAVIFPFGERDAGVSGITPRLLPSLLDGIRLGLIIAMTAIGLSLIYGTTQFTNFAHGEMVTFGALATWWFNQSIGLPVAVAAVLAIGACAILGALLDAGLWGPLRRNKTGPFGLMVVSFGLSIALLAGFQFFYGTRTQPFSQYVIQEPLFELGNQNVPPKAIWSIIISVIVLGGVALFLLKARFGKAMRAVADNAPLASASGIDTARVVRWVWVIGSALAGFGGILFSIDNQVSFQQGQSILLLMFAGITLGSLGSSFGAAAGCFILGIAIQMSTLWIPTSLKNVGALVVLIAVLMFRPQGVFGSRERVG